jgi:alkanesulfonate monooxygenase SsuD/methylene tetrahydromethanopterin reductase-like flavin-dependent oxidoreductase (luciferase family)
VSEGRFTLGVGAGERLNEHVVGRGFPAVRERHELLREALEIIQLLWRGGYRSYEGRHLRLEDARGFIDFYRSELADRIRRLAPQAAMA